MLVVAFAMHKGGVGKTVSSLRTSVELAMRGHRTLLVDMDAQSQASLYWLGDRALDELEADVSDVLDATWTGDIREVIKPTALAGLDLLPSHLRLAETELRLVADTGRRDRRLARALDKVRPDYDFAIIDCPPSLSLLTVNALAAADWIVATIECTNFAIHGLSRFLMWMERFREEGMISARLLRVLPTSYDERQVADRDGLRLLHNKGLPLFDPVPKRTGVERLITEQTMGRPGEEPPEFTAAYGAVADAIVESRQEAPV